MAVGAYVLVLAAVEVRAAREAVRLCVEALMLVARVVATLQSSEETVNTAVVSGSLVVWAARLVESC